MKRLGALECATLFRRRKEAELLAMRVHVHFEACFGSPLSNALGITDSAPLRVEGNRLRCVAVRCFRTFDGEPILQLLIIGKRGAEERRKGGNRCEFRQGFHRELILMFLAVESFNPLIHQTTCTPVNPHGFSKLRQPHDSVRDKPLRLV